MTSHKIQVHSKYGVCATGLHVEWGGWGSGLTHVDQTLVRTLPQIEQVGEETKIVKSDSENVH